MNRTGGIMTLFLLALAIVVAVITMVHLEREKRQALDERERIARLFDRLEGR